MNNLKTIILVLLLGFPLFFISGCDDDDSSATAFDITFTTAPSGATTVDDAKCKAVQTELTKLELKFGLTKHSTEAKCVTEDGKSTISVDLDNEKMTEDICNNLDTALVNAAGTPRTYWDATGSKCIQRPELTESMVYIQYNPSSATPVSDSKCTDFLNALTSDANVTASQSTWVKYAGDANGDADNLVKNNVCVEDGKKDVKAATADDAKITLTVKSSEGCASVKTALGSYADNNALKTKNIEFKYEDSKLSCVSSE